MADLITQCDVMANNYLPRDLYGNDFYMVANVPVNMQAWLS